MSKQNLYFKKIEGDLCPYCKIGELVLRRGKWSDFLGCSRYPNCGGIVKIKANESDELEKEADRILGIYK